MTAAKEEVKLPVNWVYLPRCLFAGVWHTHRAKPFNYTKTISLCTDIVKETVATFIWGSQTSMKWLISPSEFDPIILYKSLEELHDETIVSQFKSAGC